VLCVAHLQHDVLSKFRAVDAQSGAMACTAVIYGLPRAPSVDSAQIGQEIKSFLQELYGERSVAACVGVPRVRTLLLLERRLAVLEKRRVFLEASNLGNWPEPRAEASRCGRWRLQRTIGEQAQVQAQVEVERKIRPPFAGATLNSRNSG
jgi:hypothetical protein